MFFFVGIEPEDVLYANYTNVAGEALCGALG